MPRKVKMLSTRRYNKETYTHYFNYNTKANALISANTQRKQGWKVRIHKYTNVPGRIGTVYAIYRRRK